MENANKKTFYKEKNIEFETDDLFNSLHGTTIIVNGQKQNGKWMLDITITDLYDFTELIKLQDYTKGKKIFKKLLASNENNLGLIATSCNVVHKYNITIRFNMVV